MLALILGVSTAILLAMKLAGVGAVTWLGVATPLLLLVALIVSMFLFAVVAGFVMAWIDIRKLKKSKK